MSVRDSAPSTRPNPLPLSRSSTVHRPFTPPSRPDYGTSVNDSPCDSNSPSQRPRSTSCPMSMVQTYQPPVIDINEDTIPELQPIFTFLNSHSNKLYQEGYFLKLDDQNSQGKPNPDRTWSECFAQLVGTVLSLWDAAELDAAGEDSEVLPKFINLTDASIKMIDSLSTRSSEKQPLQTILSISTAGRNRYLLHFNSHHSLIQWTASIRLAMYEHSTLQEAYTGALLAGRGKSLNNINVIMERSRFKTEEWVRVRFGAGVPWRRCWCVITPPDEKEFAKLQKEMKRLPYDRSPVPVLKGDIKFYDTRMDGKKQKKVQPIATIIDAYSAYAIYPQANSLVDASTLLKIEGNVSVHSDPPSSTEGFIFIMPETHPAVRGFEMLLRFLFPTWDTFGLYGRPGRLVASVLDPRSLMFALSKHKRYGYLEPLDVSTLIEDGSSVWTEKEWRKRLKDATGTRMNAIEYGTRSHSRSVSRSSARLSGGGAGSNGGKPRVGFTDNQVSVGTSRSFSLNAGGSRTDTALPDRHMQQPISGNHPLHNASDPELGGNDFFPSAYGNPRDRRLSGEPGSSDEELGNSPPPVMREFKDMLNMQTPEPVSRPPAFNHGPQVRPTSKAYHSPELRRANSRLSSTTLDQMIKAGGFLKADDEPPTRHAEDALSPTSREGPASSLPPPSHGISNQRFRSPMAYPPHDPSNMINDANYAPRPHTADGRRPHQPPRPSRSPNPQHPNFRPDQHRPPPGAPGGPPQHGRRRPLNQRPPPKHGPQPEHHGNYGPGPGPRPYPGPQGQGGPPPNFQPSRKPLPPKAHQRITPNDIIEHYVSEAHRGVPLPNRRQPAPPPHQQGLVYGGPDKYQNGNFSGRVPDHSSEGRGSLDRPRTSPSRPLGSGKTPTQQNPEFDNSEFMRQKTPPVVSPQYSYGGTLGVRKPGNIGPSTPSPQPLHHGPGRADGPPLQPGGSANPMGGQAESFSRPLRNGPQPPHDGRHGPGPGSLHNPRNMPPQYQGQAF